MPVGEECGEEAGRNADGANCSSLRGPGPAQKGGEVRRRCAAEWYQDTGRHGTAEPGLLLLLPGPWPRALRGSAWQTGWRVLVVGSGAALG